MASTFSGVDPADALCPAERLTFYSLPIAMGTMLKRTTGDGKLLGPGQGAPIATKTNKDRLDRFHFLLEAGLGQALVDWISELHQESIGGDPTLPMS